MPEQLFDEEFLRKLRQLEVIFRRSLIGRGEGSRSGTRKGGRVEFRDFRKYAPGDDVRFVDWSVYGRTDKLFVKEYAREEQLQLCVLVDRSASMDYGRPSKFDYARRFAAAMAYLGLIARNEVRVCGFGDDLLPGSPWIGDTRRITDVMDYLRRLQPGGPTAIQPALRGFYEANPKACLAIVVSDLMDVTQSRRALRLLAFRGFDVCLFHLLHPDEQHPPFHGRIRLRDSESTRRRDVWFQGEELEEYLKVVSDFREEWSRFCAAHGMRFFSVATDVPFEELVLRYLRVGGLVR